MHNNVRETFQRFYFRRFHRFVIYIYFTLKIYDTQTVEKVSVPNERQFGISHMQHILLLKIHFKSSQGVNQQF